MYAVVLCKQIFYISTNPLSNNCIYYTHKANTFLKIRFTPS